MTNRIFVTGDFHSTNNIAKISEENWPERKELSGEDVLIQLGDFGFIWKSFIDNEERKHLQWFDSLPFYTYVVAGNHENHWRLNQYPVINFCGGKASYLSKKVIHLKNGYVYNISGKKIFVFGGATSPDKTFRTLGKSWWPEEVPSYKEMDTGIQNLIKHKFEVDYIVTHTVPTSILYHIGIINVHKDIVSEYLEHIKQLFIENKKEYKHWYAGHFHIDKTIESEKFSILYNEPPIELIQRSTYGIIF